MEYIKNLMFWKKRKDIDNLIGDGLNKEQKKKYRKQYMNLAYNVFIISLVYILGIIALISELFMYNKIWIIAIIVLILRDYSYLTYDWSIESELIVERIEKRKKKNKKQEFRGKEK